MSKLKSEFIQLQPQEQREVIKLVQSFRKQGNEVVQKTIAVPVAAAAAPSVVDAIFKQKQEYIALTQSPKYKYKLTPEDLRSEKVATAKMKLVDLESTIISDFTQKRELDTAKAEYTKALLDSNEAYRAKLQAIEDQWKKSRVSTAQVYFIAKEKYFLCHDSGRCFVQTEADSSNGIKFHALVKGSGGGPNMVITSTYNDVADISAAEFKAILDATDKPSYDELTHIYSLLRNFNLIVPTGNPTVITFCKPENT